MLDGVATVAYASTCRDGTLSIVDLVNKKPAATIAVGDDPNGVAFRKGQLPTDSEATTSPSPRGE